MTARRVDPLRAAAAVAVALVAAGLAASTAAAAPLGGGPTAAAAAAPAAGPDMSAHALVVMLVFGLIGVARGVGPEARVLVVTAASYVVFGTAWGRVAGALNKQIKLAVAGFKLSTSSGDPGEVFRAASAMPPPVPTEGSQVAVWQIAFFAVVVLLLGYRILRRVFPRPGAPAGAAPRVIDRLVGGLVAGLTGLLVAMFVLPRIVSGARISLIDTRLSIAAAAAPYKHWIVFAVVVVLLYFGVKSLGGGGPRQKVYN